MSFVISALYALLVLTIGATLICLWWFFIFEPIFKFIYGLKLKAVRFYKRRAFNWDDE